jgi:hypothetical protein
VVLLFVDGYEPASYESGMKFLPLALISFLLALSARADEPRFRGAIRVDVHPWMANCTDLADLSGECEIPQALGASPIRLTLPLEPTTGPGSVTHRTQSALLPFAEKSRVTIQTFAVEPRLDSGLPLYVQIKAEIHGPVRALCAASVRWRIPFEASPLICAAQTEGTHSIQYGMTLMFGWDE